MDKFTVAKIKTGKTRNIIGKNIETEILVYLIPVMTVLVLLDTLSYLCVCAFILILRHKPNYHVEN